MGRKLHGQVRRASKPSKQFCLPPLNLNVASTSALDVGLVAIPKHPVPGGDAPEVYSSSPSPSTRCQGGRAGLLHSPFPAHT
eukprot:6945202-Pyramimonas_sp.AAC.1